MFVYELSGCGFESSCSHLNFRFCASFDQEVPDIQATVKCGFALKRVRDMTKTYSLGSCVEKAFIFKKQLIRKCICYQEVVIRKKWPFHTTSCSEKNLSAKKVTASSGCSHFIIIMGSGNIAASIISFFRGDWCSDIRWKKVRWPNWIAANFNVRKKVQDRLKESLRSCKNLSILKNNYSTYCRITQTMDDCKFSCQEKTIVRFKAWMSAVLTVPKTDTLLQGVDSCI